MNNKILHKAETYRKTHRKKQWLYRGLSVLAAGAVFCTTYALILPAITMEKEPTCGFTEHEHSAACFSENQVIGTYSCLSDLHVHEDDCFDSDGNIICGYADFVVHSHGEFCFDENGDLICELPEILVHTHVEDCFAVPEEAEAHEHREDCFILQKGDLLCETEESDSHTHDDTCVGINSKTLICTVEESEGHLHTVTCEGIVSEMLSCELEESEGHSHSGECYQTVQTENLICGSEESDGHAHDETCVDENGELICETEETEGHFHSSECYELTQELVCELEESEGYAHSDDCYTIETGYICGLEESEGHIHKDDCYEIQNGYICGLEESEGHIHNDECYEWTEELVCDIESNEEPAEEDTELEAVCGYDEIILHEHDEIECFDADGNLICGRMQVLEHIHTEECLVVEEQELICGLEEHIHDELLCYIDEEADIETEEDWEATLPEELTGNWAEDLIAVAESQLGYTESETNMLVGVNGEISHYSRYGAWFGHPYAEWNQIFLSFCLNYAGIPEDAIPQTADTEEFISAVSEMGILEDSDYGPQVGDIAVLETEYGERTVGIVTELTTDDYGYMSSGILSGDIDGKVYWAETDENNIRYVSVGHVYDMYTDPVERTLQAVGSDYIITVTFDKTAEIPDNAQLVAEEIHNTFSTEYYSEEARLLLEEQREAKLEMTFARIFDISFMNEGEKIEPAEGSEVQVSVIFTDGMEIYDGENFDVIHFKDDDTAEILSEVSVDEAIEFTTGEFSTWVFGKTLISEEDADEAYDDIIDETDRLAAIDVTIEKVDQNDNPLEGASFMLQKLSDDNTWEDIEVEIVPVIPEEGSSAVYVIEDLLRGTYCLTETQAPAGYLLMTETFIFVVEGGSITTESTYKDVKVEENTITIINRTGYVLPSTGGIGTFLYTFGGLMIVGASGILFMYKSRRRLKE